MARPAQGVLTLSPSTKRGGDGLLVWPSIVVTCPGPVRRYGGSFATKREALIRKAWIAGELTALRMPDLRLLASETAAETVATAAERWQASRVDVAAGTAQAYRVALGWILPKIGHVPLDEVSVATVTDLAAELGSLNRESLRKTLSVLVMILDPERRVFRHQSKLSEEGETALFPGDIWNTYQPNLCNSRERQGVSLAGACASQSQLRSRDDR